MMTALSRLIANQPEGYSLQQVFYQDNDIYLRELDRLFMKSWLYAGHLSQIPETGDYFLYELGNESVIIIRSGENTVKALLNLCRASRLTHLHGIQRAADTAGMPLPRLDLSA